MESSVYVSNSTQLSDMIVELDQARSSNQSMEAERRKFDQILEEERARSLLDRDSAAHEVFLPSTVFLPYLRNDSSNHFPINVIIVF